MSKSFDATFRSEQPLGPVVSVGPATPPKTALDVQIGGQHYKSLKIQPVEFVAANGLDFFQGNILKYITRRKGDVEKRLEDLNKAKHYIDLYMDFIKKGEVK